MGLKDLCQSIHEAYAEYDVAKLTTEMYLSDLQPAMTPSDAYAKISHRQTERVEIEQLEGRITTSLLTPYPPGIPLLVPGERFNQKIVDYLRFTRDFNKRFPGFDTDVHGLVEKSLDNGAVRYYVDCVKPV
jgi:arginine/lysine/ornithine decarboxylase